MPLPPRRATEVVPELRFSGEIRKMADVADKDLTVTKAKFVNGDFGTYTLFECVDADGVAFSVASSAQNVQLMAQKLIDANAFPVIAKFSKVKTHKGRSVWTIS